LPIALISEIVCDAESQASLHMQSCPDVLKVAKPRLAVMPDMAFNAEALPQNLDSDITPISEFFVRNNGTLPDLGDDAVATWRLEIDGEVEQPSSFTIGDLKRRFEVVSATAVLECAGNGRAFFDPATDGVPWRLGAVGCALWTGVRLRDVLQFVGVKATAVYTGHYSPDKKLGSLAPAISRGLPIAKAFAEETLIAFAMNGEPLPLLHGGPLRVVAPGFPGSAWQKWLTRISLLEREHDGEKMTGTDYRLPTVPVKPGEVFDPAAFAVITDIPVKSLVTHPPGVFEAKQGDIIEVRGYAWSGHDPVASVAVSVNGGASWLRADLGELPSRFAWRRFHALVYFDEAGVLEVLARATTLSGRSQPLESPPWNPRGYCNNTVHRVAGNILTSPPQ
jgi:DMSO/TMAO reductase YedYZ molybdopterin-dependent catalytic subunit